MDEKQELGRMTTTELKAYRRILRMSERCICSRDDRELNTRHAALVDEILAGRT